MKQTTTTLNDKSQMCAIYNGLEKIYRYTLLLVKFEVKTLRDLKELLSDIVSPTTPLAIF